MFRTVSSGFIAPENPADRWVSHALVMETVQFPKVPTEPEVEGSALFQEKGPIMNEATGECYGPRGPEPTRYGDWKRGGRCTDF